MSNNLYGAQLLYRPNEGTSDRWMRSMLQLQVLETLHALGVSEVVIENDTLLMPDGKWIVTNYWGEQVHEPLLSTGKGGNE